METFFQVLRSTFGSEQPAAVLFVLLSATAVAILALGLLLIAAGAMDPLRRRMARLAHDAGSDLSQASTIASILRPMADRFMPRQEWKRNQINHQLAQAGFRSPGAPTVFHGLRALLALILPLLVVFSARWIPNLSSTTLLIYVLAAAVIGALVPGMVLDRLVARRLRRLRQAFPDALDLLVVCVESGLGLSPAIQRVADELSISHPDLSAELAIVNAEIRAGVDRSEALKNLADRTGLRDIRGLVALLVQTMKFGTSIADALRVYSEEFRDKRMQAAEEKAAKMATKLIFPLIFCMLPAFFIVAAGPGVMGLISAFSQLGGK